MSASSENTKARKGGAFLVAAGILLSRLAGLARERIFAHYFGSSDAGDAFKAALKIPNFLQNLFGEGVLSASFIPVYAKLLAERDDESSQKLAGAIFSWLALITSCLVLGGIWASPYCIQFIAPGFSEEKKQLTIRLVQIFFPGTGLLVMSAWCLGVLNSHRRFFLSYVAPVIWNFAIIGVLLVFGSSRSQSQLAVTAAWGLVLGSALQFIVQLPTTLLLIKKFKPNFDRLSHSVRTVLRNFFPVVIARGVVQVSAYIDNVLASLLPSGAVSSLAYAQVIYLLPVSLFGMSISAAELPEMSSAVGSASEVAAKLRTRLELALERVTFYIVPSVAAFLFFGDVIVGALYQGGAFHRDNTIEVWSVLAGSTVGLLASTMGRLYSSAFYALRDTRSPLRFALVRVFLTTILGYSFALYLPPLLHISLHWGTAGLTASAGLAGWVEFFLLRRGLAKKIGAVHLPLDKLGKYWLAAVPGVAIASLLRLPLGGLHPILLVPLLLGPYGLLYLVLCGQLGVGDQVLLRRLRLSRNSR